MTHDAETVQRVAKALYPNIWGDPDASFFGMQPKGQSREVSLRVWENNANPYRKKARNQARAALSALPPQEVIGDPIYQLRQMPVSTCPKGVPVLIAGGVAMLKTGGDWYTGMYEPMFSRKLNWSPEWWANIPNGNEPHPLSEKPHE
tara:strand:- start:2545 stop:2985 length:441 start_codon:yes stop_codon:yes gene_type:complete